MAKIAIMGFGTVGSGIYDIIVQNSKKLRRNTYGEEIEVKYILDIRDFPEHPQKELFTKDFDVIANDPEITVAAETMGGLHPAYEFTKSLLLAGKSVVTSNKELVATYGTELLELASQNNVNYMFEASVGGGIPVIRPLHQDLTANKITRIAGILNGTTNYILYQMFTNNRSFEDALSDAQAKGYAEKNPAADIEGHDACRKIAILASLASGTAVDYRDIETDGIVNITLDDVKYAEKAGSVIKLIGYADFLPGGRIYAVVSPMLVPRSNLLSSVNDVYNAIMVTGNCVGDLMFYGAGAGKLPTASAVVADIVDCVRHRERPKKIGWEKPEGDINASRDDVTFSYFVRTPDTSDNVNDIFGSVKFISEDGNERVFITEKLGGSDAEKAFSALSSVTTALRVLD
ncbi:MAG TPA: homoserine dehydrogenase [Candidatus Ornithomonoglobus intestinigallinarum]|uniref:Homoserine dehydrogenase n=1 Tax=Candidatus Ornithomonoglobus intestinigallinarum TaxID=2840894 RepID=A0A9D1H3U9_9FIRM|nr:homoserine dehydrogenase [Candidatus Ornithomonoglobus intestinigallinarum]